MCDHIFIRIETICIVKKHENLSPRNPETILNQRQIRYPFQDNAQDRKISPGHLKDLEDAPRCFKKTPKPPQENVQ